MSVMLIDREAETIDEYRPRVSETALKVTQADDANEDLQTVGGTKLPELPDPAVGGANGSRIRNGYSTGFRSLFTRQQPFSGAVATPPAITNPVQGDVGVSNRGARLRAGVMNQAATYTPAQSFALAYVGAMPDTEKK